MKWILLATMAFILSSCCCNTAVVEYRQVAVTPVIEPVYYNPAGVIDVTTTSIDYY